jgi:hypothetical protein
MARRKSEADRVVEFFTTAPDAEASILFDVVRGIMSRRQPKTKTKKAKPQTINPAKESEQS